MALDTRSSYVRFAANFQSMSTIDAQKSQSTKQNRRVLSVQLHLSCT